MAVRDDFAAGEVLAAADLNDTFASKLAYPTGGNDGDLLAKDGTAAEWIAVPEAGMTLVASESFASVGSVSVNNCFTSAYQNYRMMVFLTSVSAAEVIMRIRDAGSDRNTATHLKANRGITDGGTLFSDAAAGLDGFRLSFTNASHTYALTLDIFGIQSTDRCNIIGNAMAFNSAGGSFASVRIGGKANFAPSTGDGFTLSVSTGNMTGNVRVFGYRNS